MDAYVSTPCSTIYNDPEPNDSELARIINCDLAVNNLTTYDTAKKIWTNLNERCIEKFGDEDQDHIKNNVVMSDITWACKTLPAYCSWNKINDYYSDINRWIEKINNFCKLSLSNLLVYS